MLRRIKKDVEHELTDKLEVLVYCPLTTRQKLLYMGLKRKIRIEDLLQGLGSQSQNSAIASSLMNLVMQFRKVRYILYINFMWFSVLNYRKCLKTGLVLILNTSLGFWMLDFRTFTVDNFYVVIVELIHRLSIKLEMSQQIMKSVAQPRPKSKHVFLNDRLQFQSQTTSIKPNVRNPNDNN